MVREILTCELINSGNGTHKYMCAWRGKFEDWELINAVDNNKFFDPKEEDLCCCNYGGNVTIINNQENGIYNGIIEVYYD